MRYSALTEFLYDDVQKLRQWTESVTSEWTVTEGVWAHMYQSDRGGEVRCRLSRPTGLSSSKDLVAEGNHLLADDLITDDDQMDAVVLHPDEDRLLLIAAARGTRRPLR